MTNSSVYTEEEIAVLEKTKKVRLDVINNMTKEGVPNKTSDLRVMNEYMNSLDEAINKAATNRLKHEDNNNKDAIAASIASALLEIDNRRQDMTRARVLVMPDDYIPTDIVPGEMDINPSKLDINDFIQPDEE